MDMIEVKNLSRGFSVTQKDPGLAGSVRALFKPQKREKLALRNLSLSVSKPGILGLVGPNGAGKTTLVKILCGIIHPSSGEASVLGYRPALRDPKFCAQIGLIMGQKAQLWWDLPAGDSFLLLKEIYGIAEADFKVRRDELVDLLKVEHVMKTQLRRLSLGERMKMELIASLLHRPKVLFLDEPTIGLDLTAQQNIRGFLREYQRMHQTVIILTSHYMEDIEALAERVVLVDEGAIVFDGALLDMKSRYATEQRIVVRGENVAIALVQATLKSVVQDNINISVCAAADGSIVISTPRNFVPSIAGKLFADAQVTNLTIEDVDIGTVIQSVLADSAQRSTSKEQWR